MLQHFVYLDRYRNGGTRVYSRHADYTEAQDRFRPDSSHPSFELPTYSLPLAEVNVYQSNPAAELEARYLPGDGGLFCIHPQLLSARPDDRYVKRVIRHGIPAEPIQVSPSSSTRTLFVHDSGGNEEDAPSHALKVHFPFRISRYGRKMRDEVVEQAITVSAELEAGMEDMAERLRRMRGEPDEGPASFAFLREVLGITLTNLDPKSPRGENWGFLVRDLSPFPSVAGSASSGPTGPPPTLVPAFALYGQDFFDPTAPPLIFDFLGGQDPRDVILQKIFFPIIRHWVACFLTFGLVLEPHGQNVLLEIEPDGSVGRCVHRDMSVAIDMRRRRDIGRSSEALNRYNRMETGEFNSIAYDMFMGGHFFQRLLDTVLVSFPSLTVEDFRGPCREEFHHLFPGHERYLPRTVRYFSEERDEFGKPHFVDTGRAPVWRP